MGFDPLRRLDCRRWGRGSEPASKLSAPDELETTFGDAIARGWGLALNCQPCGEFKRWSDAELAQRFIMQPDSPMSVLRGRVKCPTCRRTNLRIHPYQAGAMNWRQGKTQTSDMLAIIEDHKAELREMARAKADAEAGPSSYAGTKMRS